jgi:hypothetical protein
VALSCDRLARHLSIHPSQNCVAKRKKLDLQRYHDVIWRREAQLIEITHFRDRHFWHRGYDKACLGVDFSGPMVFERGLQFTSWADAGEAEGRDGDGHGSLYLLGRGLGEVRADNRAEGPTASHANRTGHPAGGRYVSRQVSWLTGQCACPAFPGFGNPSDTDGQSLAAYSCGGSAGVSPASLLAPRRT